MVSMVSFRLLTEYHSFLYGYSISFKQLDAVDVSVSLRSIIHSYDKHVCRHRDCCDKVSVSLRSIIHSYVSKARNVFNLLYSEVSVSLRSIIHSYPMVKKVFFCNIFLECYRVIFLFLKFFCLFQLKASLTPYFLNIV